MKQVLLQTESGFTFVELMTILLIVGVLAAVGFPVYQEYLITARTAEAYQTLDIVKKDEISYFLENKHFQSTTLFPQAAKDSSTQVWEQGSHQYTTWTYLGIPVATDSRTYFSYMVYSGKGGDVYTSENTPAGHTTSDSIDGLFEDGASKVMQRCTGSGDIASLGFNPGFTSPQGLGVDSSVENWAILIAIGNLNKSNNKCRFIMALMEANPGSAPALKNGFIQFDSDLDTLAGNANSCESHCNGDEGCLNTCNDCVASCSGDPDCEAACLR